VTFVGGEAPATPELRVINAGQLPLAVESIILRPQSGGGEPITLVDSLGPPLEGSESRTISLSIPVDLEPGAHDVVLMAESGEQGSAPIRLMALPTCVLKTALEEEGHPLIELSLVEEAETDATDGADWAGEFHVEVAGRGSGAPFHLTRLEANVFDQSFPLLQEDPVVHGMKEFPARIKVDRHEAEKARDDLGRGEVVMRVRGYPEDIVREFRVSRSRSATLEIGISQFTTHLSKLKGSKDAKTIVHGLGRTCKAPVHLYNTGDLDVEIAGPIEATTSALRVMNSTEHTGKSVPKRGGDGLKIEIELTPDGIAFQDLPTFPGMDTPERKMELAIRVPVRTKGDDQETSNLQQVRIQTLAAKQVSISYGDHLFLDFGTTNSCVALVRAGEDRPTMLDVDRTDNMGDLYPSLVRYVDFEKKTEKFGENVRNEMRIDTERFLATASEFKPYIGDARHRRFYTDDNRDTQPRTARESAARFLDHIFEELRRYELEAIPEAVHLSFPLSFSTQDQETLENLVSSAAGEKSEANALTSEPAALLANLLHGEGGLGLRHGESRVIAVFDFGGGTTDLLLTRATHEPDGYKLEHFAREVVIQGGERLTRTIAQGVWPGLRDLLLDREDIAIEHERVLNSFVVPDDPAAIIQLSGPHQKLYSTLLRQAEDLKVNYSDLRRQADGTGDTVETGQARYEIQGDVEGIKSVGAEVPLFDAFQIDTMNDVIDAFVRPMLNTLLKMEYDARKIEEELKIDIVLLAGNSSRLKRVKELASEVFDAELAEGAPKRVRFAGNEHAKEGVVKGLAYWHLNPPFEVHQGQEESEIPRFGFRHRGNIIHAGKPHTARFGKGDRIAIFETTISGELKDSPTCFIRIKAAMGDPPRPIEQLQVVLEESGEGVVLQVYDPLPEGAPNTLDPARHRITLQGEE